MAKRKIEHQKKRKNTKKQKKTAFKDIIFELDIILKATWYYKITENYFVFSPFGEETNCDVIGIDIGTKHLGISGILKTEQRKFPVWSWCSLISVPAKNLHESVDHMVDILIDSPHFEWFRKCSCFRIELQMHVNPKARAVACVLRTLARVFQKKNNLPIDVEFVHGELKYAIGPLYSENARNDPLREIYLGGHSNTQKRKILGKNDAVNLLEENGEKYMLKFLRTFDKYVDQLYDMTDAYLVGRTKFEKNLKIIRPKKAKVIVESDSEND